MNFSADRSESNFLSHSTSNLKNSHHEQSHYSNYLQLPSLLSCQQPLTHSQDEDFFISVHQICELAFRQMIADMKRVLEAIALALQDETDLIIGNTSEACYFFDRLLKFYEVVINTMITLKTMKNFSEFRPNLGSMSGFQSFQFRHLEIMSGVDKYWENAILNSDNLSENKANKLDIYYNGVINQWLDIHRSHNLAYYYNILLDRVPLSLHSDKIDRLLQNVYARPLLTQMSVYETRQNHFHQAHLKLATQQLAKIGVAKGTGGTCFQQYLTRYHTQHGKLFPGLIVL